jgi:hypothetical protein
MSLSQPHTIKSTYKTASSTIQIGKTYLFDPNSFG